MASSLLYGSVSFLGITISKLGTDNLLAKISALTTPPRGMPKTRICSFGSFFKEDFVASARIFAADDLFLNLN